jgi:hypothetical protein
MNAIVLSPYERTSRSRVNVSIRQLVASDLTTQVAEGRAIVGTLLSKRRGPELLLLVGGALIMLIQMSLYVFG